MENLVIDPYFWKNKTVLVTGHTGFKGSWLSIWLQSLGAKVIGVSLDPPTNPSLYQRANVAEGITSLRADIRHPDKIANIVTNHKPDILFHLAAQPLVRYSYHYPTETYATNVMGTLHVLEAIRKSSSVRSAIMVTTDKCYDNKEWAWGYRENEPMGGYDPYSSSKGAAELLIASYRNSYYSKESFSTGIASVRAGNVIGGGDWAQDRLIPDIIQSFQNNQTLKIRNPHAIRPWQHVLEPLSGYMQLAQKLYFDHSYAQAWNFGPHDHDTRTVEWIVNKLSSLWGGVQSNWSIDTSNQPHEAHYLKLDCSKAHSELNWHPIWTLETSLTKIVEWHKKEQDSPPEKTKKLCLLQIQKYQEDVKIQD